MSALAGAEAGDSCYYLSMAQIIVIDDDKDITEVVEMYLDGCGHEVSSFSSAEDGLNWMKDHQVDLLITDILMPGMNGLELIEEMNKMSPSTKVIAISGGGETGGIVTSMALDQAMELGAERALSKPFTKDDLVRRVDKLLKA